MHCTRDGSEEGSGYDAVGLMGEDLLSPPSRVSVLLA